MALQQKSHLIPGSPIACRAQRPSPGGRGAKTEGIKKIQAMQSRRHWGPHLQPVLPLLLVLCLATPVMNCSGLSRSVGACGHAEQSPRAQEGCGVRSLGGDRVGG